MIFGLLSSVVLARGSPLKAIGMVVLGLLLGLVGVDVTSGITRFAFGNLELSDGIQFVSLALGLFGVVEIVTNLERGTDTRTTTASVNRLWPTRDDWRRSWPAVLRGTGLGSILGLLPGGGATISAFGAYMIEKRISRHPERFGNGAVEGVAAPEAANNAAAQTSFVPLLMFGLPSTAVMALMMGAMMVHGIAPGTIMLTARPDLFWGLIVSMWIGNLMLLVINLPLIRIWVLLLSVPYRMLFPAILLFCCIGVYSLNFSSFDIFVLTAFSLLGYVLKKLDLEAAPLLLGFVLGPLLEEHLRRALLLSDGSVLVFVERPISLTLLILAVAIAALLVLPRFRSVRKEAFEEDD
jgi:putative tricarboxylic transport membrane protein